MSGKESWRALAACVALLLADVPAPVAANQVQISPVDLVQVTLSMPGKVTIGQQFRVMDEVESVGNAPAAQSVTYFYLSTDDTVDDGDLVVAGRRVPPLGPGATSGEFTSITLTAKIQPGTYFLIAKANATKTVDERYVDNNTKATKVVVREAGQKK